MNSARELHETLERALARPIESVLREGYAYGTSFEIDVLEVREPDGSVTRLLLKDLGGASEEARSVKPAFLDDPLREIDVYCEILAGRALGTAHCYGSVVDPRRSRYWLFLEHVPGVELWQVGELSIWQQAARWLAQLHESCRDVTHPRLLRCDRVFYEQWLKRALAVNDDRRLQAIAASFPAVVERLLAQLPVGALSFERRIAERPVQRMVGNQAVEREADVMAVARPAVVLGRAYKPGAHRRHLDNAARQQEIPLPFDYRGTVAALPQCAATRITPVEVRNVAAPHRLHCLRQARLLSGRDEQLD